MSLGPYASFIVTSYALVALVLVLLIAWIVLAVVRRHRRKLARADALRSRRHTTTDPTG